MQSDESDSSSTPSSSSSNDDDQNRAPPPRERPKLRDLRKLTPEEVLGKEKEEVVINLDEKTREETRRRYIEAMIAEEEKNSPSTNYYGIKCSHEFIDVDEDGMLPLDKFVYVEEVDCIGCTHCQQTAINTFFMEDEHGRARVFNQLGDAEETIEEAIDTCPVNCIYYVDWNDLVTLELERNDQFINNWARLVGGQDFLSSKTAKKKTTVMDSGIMRCEDCPGRGCQTCPLYGVGENPEFIRKKKIRLQKKAQREEKEKKKSGFNRKKSF